eukprot:TRINITY_DN13714_c0_g1_i1.p1 TRINITY_DN13714_c0_g1~~TRINITY_DN13714_c0_g1_i1.p1  ORF type:complete len:174 (-),score=40.26 TRINITY_DN13714_c0_g1_i1:221-742(-)
MSSKAEGASTAASEKIRSASLSANKGLSRAQAERAADAAARNINAYGQKEEGVSRTAERKEAKRQMYLESTERAVTIGAKPRDPGMQMCQKCYKTGHWTKDCLQGERNLGQEALDEKVATKQLETMSASREKKEESARRAKRKEREKQKAKEKKAEKQREKKRRRKSEEKKRS